jgi:hypothetical protein
MKRYPVSMARERLADVLDEADRSGAVVIERRGVQYVLRPKPAGALLAPLTERESLAI